jgi:hypothetical protein
MAQRMEWEGGPVLKEVKEVIGERMCREKRVRRVLEKFPDGLPKPWGGAQGC